MPEDDPWGQFSDAAPVDVWSQFPDAPKKGAKRVPKPRKQVADAPRITSAVDGDTVNTTGPDVRLWGVDAPELRQIGLDRDGRPVPIGEQSKQALGEIVVNPALVGNPVSQSFGRPVAPLTVDGLDVGQQLARDGNALAAPEYLESDQDRRFRYMQAERLARQNGLGVHKTQFQPPAEFRRDPIAPAQLPERVDVPQFWDTPTPFSGMRPEVEQEYIRQINDPSVPPEKVLEYARANGFQFDPAKLIESRAIAAKNAANIGINYQELPKPLTDQGDGKTGAAARGIGNGVLPNFLEETGAVVDTLGITPGRENVWNSDRRLADIYVNNLGQNEAITGYDRLAHPYVTGASEIAGGVIVPMGRINSAADLAKWGAGFGMVSGLGQEGTIPERMTSGVIGTGQGIATTVLGGKALEAATPYAGKAWQRLTGRGASEAPVGAAAPRMPDRIDVGSGAPPAPAPPPPRLPGYVPRPGQRVPDWIDTGAPIPRIGPEGPTAPAQANDYEVLIGQGVSPAEAARRLALSDPRFQGIATTPDAQGDLALTYSYVRATNPDAVSQAAAQNMPVEAQPWFQSAAEQARKRFGVDESGMLSAPARDAMRRQIMESAQQPNGGNGQASSMAMAGDAGPAITSEMPRQRDYLFPDKPQPISQPITEAQRRAMAETVDPRDVVPIPSNQVGNVEEAAAIDAGRYAEVKAPNERAELAKRTVRAWSGAEVPKVGPTDLVGWLRLQGGLADQGGELSHMGLTNAGRKLEFAGQEQRFGPLVNEAGMSLDDASLRAWEAGYFPDHADRPTISEFLDGLRNTYEGRNRHFLPDDLPEIDAYRAAQAERYAIEEQRFETGQPVMEDRSVPADEPQPFPPPQAYEEWPSGGPDFAGNIDLRKLESPQDIKRALDFTQRRVGFDAATRGRVSHAETERLASDLGMTPEKLLSRRQGQALNAEEALAARQILAKSGNELVNLAKRVRSMDEPGDDLMAEFQQAWTRHAAIQEQVAGMTAEAGRTLQQFRMLADSRNVRGDVLSAMVASGGGRKRLQDAANIILDAVETGQPGKFNTVVEKASKPQFRDKLTELWINSLLTNPATHVVNMTSNTLTAMAQIPEHAAASVIGKVRQALPKANPDRIIASEVGARTFGMIQGAKEGALMFARTLRSGDPSDMVSKVEQQNFKAISGLKGEIVRIPTRFLGAEDELFKGIARRMELNGLAVRHAHSEGLKGEAAQSRIAELVADPPDAMLQRSMEYARYVTFQQKLGPDAAKLSAFTQNQRWAKLFLPFIRTPTNLIKFASERSPLAPIMPSWRADIKAGGARRDLAVAKMMVGTGFGVALYEAALSGHITGSAPPDRAKSRLLYADGWQPYSIRVGDKWYSYKRLDPFSTTIGTAADLALLPEGMSASQRENKVALFIASIMGNLASKTWLSGISDVVGALSEPEMNAERLINRLTGSLAVPAGVAGLARTIDPVARETDGWQDAIQARVPFASKSLPARRDVWGEQVVSEGGVGPDFLSPIYTKTAKDDPVNRELGALDYAPGKLRDTVAGVKLTPQQHDRYQMEAGRRAHAKVGQLIASDGWESMDLDAREAAAKKAVAQGREEARAVLFGGNAPPRKSAANDEWSQFKDAGSKRVPGPEVVPPRLPANDPWSDFKDPPQRDVLGSLSKIPGLTPDLMTSGYRTPEYQAEMRRRGYKPADNSGHLDGSSLDIVVPSGRSMSWLVAQVKKAEPTARLLPEGDHLHATFPGWYGAPVLGGAKAAGLRNPNRRLP